LELGGDGGKECCFECNVDGDVTIDTLGLGDDNDGDDRRDIAGGDVNGLSVGALALFFS
jgi:hypothetical protein